MSANKNFHITAQAIDAHDPELRELNLKIHDNPETCYKEYKAHENITQFLEAKGVTVERHAFGLETSFVAEYGKGGRVVTYCAEYDALPVIGHGCGHNLICVSSVAAFLGVVEAMKTDPSITGRVRLLGCPAEEGEGGKIRLINAGAYKDVDAAIMTHPTPFASKMPEADGIAYGTCLAAVGFLAKFKGRPAHAAAMPWAGINAADAASLAYNAVGLLRQHIKPNDRINIIIPQAGTGHNVIPDTSTVRVSVRSETSSQMEELRTRVENCCKGAALATGCSLELLAVMDPYADLRPNESLCNEFTQNMALSGKKYYNDQSVRDLSCFSTDMGNVSYEVPSFHGNFCIQTDADVALHTAGFRDAARKPDAHALAMGVGKGMAGAGLRVLTDEAFATEVREDFKRDQAAR